MMWSNMLPSEDDLGKDWFWQLSAQMRSDTPLEIRQQDTGRTLWRGMRGKMPPAYNQMSLYGDHAVYMDGGYLVCNLDVDEDFVRAQYAGLPDDVAAQMAEEACWS